MKSIARWLLLALLIGSALWWWLREQPSVDTATAGSVAVSPVQAPGPSLPADPDAGTAPAPAPEPAPAVQIFLLPDGGVSADPASVRIGLAAIAAEDLAAALAGQDGAGPAAITEFLRVTEWRSLPATALADGRVQIGPLTLPGAEYYVLQAAGTDDLRQYDADFPRVEIPATVAPLLAAGLRVERSPALPGEITVLLRRQGELSEAPRWQRVQQRQPALLAAYSEQPLALGAGETMLAPLPPQPVEALLLVDGIEAQRQPLDLRAGQWSTLKLDPLAHAVARRLSVDLRLRVLVAGSTTPIADVRVRWQHERGEREAVSDSRGEVRFAGVDRQRPQHFELSFPPVQDTLPRWPATRTVELLLDERYPESRDQRELTHTVEIAPLQWLILSAPVPLDPARNAGQPYPVHVLQQRLADGWQDVAAEEFRPLGQTLAVSVASDGEYRVASVYTPWTMGYSNAADTRRPAADGRYPVQLQFGNGRSVELLLRHRSQPQPRLQIAAIGPLRGMPPSQLTADMNGRIRLDGVNVDQLLLEAPGYAQQSVDLRTPSVVVDLEERGG